MLKSQRWPQRMINSDGNFAHLGIAYKAKTRSSIWSADAKQLPDILVPWFHVKCELRRRKSCEQFGAWYWNSQRPILLLWSVGSWGIYSIDILRIGSVLRKMWLLSSGNKQSHGREVERQFFLNGTIQKRKCCIRELFQIGFKEPGGLHR